MKDLSPWRIQRTFDDEDTDSEYGYNPPADEPQIRRYWAALIRRWPIVLSIFLVVTAVGTYIAITATPLYTASATVKIEPQNPADLGLSGAWPVQGGEGSADYYATQYVLLKSRSLAATVIRELQLESNTAFTNMRIVSANPRARIVSWVMSVVDSLVSPVLKLIRLAFRDDEQRAAAQSQSKTVASCRLTNRYLGLLKVNPVGNTRLVQVSFTTPNALLSKELANSHASIFIKTGLQNRSQLTREAREFLDKRNAELKDKLTRAEKALNAFRQKHGVVSLDKGENIVVDRLVALSQDLTKARSQRIEAEALVRTVANKNFQDLSQIVTQGLVPQLKSNLSNLENEAVRLSTVFKPNHPRIIAINQQIKEARQALDSEIANVVRSIQSNYAATKAREDALQAEVDRQKRTALSLKEIGAEYAVLQEEVNVNRSIYEGVLKRLNETTSSSDIGLSNIQIAEAAEVPLSASSPNRQRSLTLTILFALFLGAGTASLMEYMDSRVKSVADVWRATSIPTVGIVPHFSLAQHRTYSYKRLLKNPAFDYLRLRGPVAHSSTNQDLTISHHPLSLISESYRNIRSALLLSQPEKPPQVILVTSGHPNEGKTVTTINLAISFAQNGHSVLLIDGDLRKGCCHVLLRIQNYRGLADVLTGHVDLDQAVKQTGVAGLSLLSRGRFPPSPPDLLGTV